MSTCARRGLLAFAFLLVAIAVPAWAQEAPPPGASDYSSFDATAVVSEASRLRSGSLADESAPRALAKRAAMLVLEAEAPQGRPTEIWNQLATLATPALESLPPDQRDQLRLKLLGGATAGTPEDWADLQHRVLLVSAVDRTGQAATALVEDWLQSHDLNSLSISDLQFCIKHCLPNLVDRKAFAVTWTGFLTAPRSGAYKFSTTPINVNKQFGADRVRHSLGATVGGVAVLNAVPPNPEEVRARLARQLDEARAGAPQAGESPEIVDWPFEGEPVELQAGQAVPIQVEMTYECTQPNPADMPNAILCWEGPGMSRRPVFKESLTSGDGSPPGLRAEYRWQEHGEPRTAMLESSTIDLTLASAAQAAPPNPKLVDRLTARYWQMATDPAYIEQCATGAHVHAFFEDDESTAGLSAAQRQEFLELATNNLALLDRLTARQLLLIYRKLRFGAEEQAIELLGAWAQSHADLAPQLSLSFFDDNRRSFSELGIALALQAPEQLEQLRHDFLISDDGRCVLPIAYILDHGYGAKDAAGFQFEAGIPSAGARQQWISFLAEQLADDSLVAEQRVNWLLARCQAAEGEDLPSGQALLGQGRLLNGREWLQECNLIAESAETQARVQKEWCARFVAYRMWDEVRKTLGAQSVDPLTEQWQAKCQELERQALTLEASAAQRTKYVLLAEYQRKLRKATDAKNEVAVARYSELIERLDSNGSTDN